MYYSTNKINSLFAFVLFLLISLSNTFVFNLIHKHGEMNLHFHPENLLTKDHTIAVDADCSLCEAIFNSINFIFDPFKNTTFHHRIYTIIIFTHTNSMVSEYIFYYSGRSPPIPNS